jgi:nitroimidazol reductase NimA-like FMN-containing flavoprotein (pyridoxamine 5'-phosphate oxidase superfamily)
LPATPFESKAEAVATTPSERARVRRGPTKGHYDPAAITAVLDRGLLAHVAFAIDADIYCIPMLYARVGDDVHIHGSTASRAMRTLAAGVPACLTVTIVDGLVLARSVFEHSANYESLIAFGHFRPIADARKRLAALEAFTEKLLPGRWSEVRKPSRQELKATTLLAMTITEASVKRRSGPPDDDDTPDAAIDTWAGIIPLVISFGTPVASPGLRAGTSLNTSIRELLAKAETEPQ